MTRVERIQGDFKPVRVYFGAEFCQTLFPSPDELMEAYEAASASGWQFTLVTPPVTDKGLRKLKPVFAFLAEQKAGIEVVVNDWGVLRLLSQTYCHLKPVLGRLMNKMLRDPRITPRYNAEHAPKESLLAFQQSGITSHNHCQLLRSFGVDRVELDNLYQGIAIDFGALGLRPSIYVPYGYVTTGRPCLFGALSQPKTKKFSSTTSCQKECRRYIATMTDSSAQDNGTRLLHRGNTIFYQQDGEMVKKALVWAEEHAARVVYQRSPFERVAYATEDCELVKGWIKGTYEV